MKFSADAESEIKFVPYICRRHISHCEAIFHPPARVDLARKKIFLLFLRMNSNPYTVAIERIQCRDYDILAKSIDKHLCVEYNDT